MLFNYINEKRGQYCPLFLTLWNITSVELFVFTVMQGGDFARGEEPPCPSPEVLFGKAGEIYPVELLYFVTHMLEYTPNDAVATRMYLDPDLFLIILDVIDGVGRNIPVVEGDAGCNLLHIGFGERLVEGHLVYFFLVISRVGKALGHITVVSYEQYTQAVLIEPSDRINTLLHRIFEKIHNGFVRMGSSIVVT